MWFLMSLQRDFARNADPVGDFVNQFQGVGRCAGRSVFQFIHPDGNRVILNRLFRIDARQAAQQGGALG